MYAQEEDRRKARGAGFDALVAKSADANELVRPHEPADRLTHDGHARVGRRNGRRHES